MQTIHCKIPSFYVKRYNNKSNYSVKGYNIYFMSQMKQPKYYIQGYN